MYSTSKTINYYYYYFYHCLPQLLRFIPSCIICLYCVLVRKGCTQKSAKVWWYGVRICLVHRFYVIYHFLLLFRCVSIAPTPRSTTALIHHITTINRNITTINRNITTIYQNVITIYLSLFQILTVLLLLIS